MPNRRESRKILGLVTFIAPVWAFGALIGIMTGPDNFYSYLQQPVFAPDPRTHAGLSLLAYLIMGWMGWRIWIARPRGPAMQLWVVQVFLTWAESSIFFVRGLPWLSLVLMCFIFFITAVIMLLVAEISIAAAWFYLPLLSWNGFNTAVLLGIAVLN